MKMKQSGVSLLEIMMGLVLTSFTIAMLLHNHEMIKKHYLLTQKTLEKSSELQTVARLIRTSVQQAGFTPCLNMNHLIVVDHRYGYSKLPALTVENSSVLKTNRMSSDFVEVQVLNENHLEIDAPLPNREQTLLIADCYHAETTLIQSTHQNGLKETIFLKNPLMFHYSPPIYIGALEQNIYFIKPDQSGHGRLFFQASEAEELTPWVQAMQIKLSHLSKGTLLDVHLQLMDDQEMEVAAMVRTL